MKLLIRLFGILVILTLLLSSACAPKTSSGEYDVTGSGCTTTADITYSTPGGGTAQATGATLPWSYTFTGNKTDGSQSGMYVYVSAQNDCGTGGTVTTTIKQDNGVFQTNSSSGAYAIATSSGSF